MEAEPAIRAAPARLLRRFFGVPFFFSWLLVAISLDAAWAAPVAHRYGAHTFWVDTLENGLQAISVPDDTEPTATVFVIYSVGNRMEEEHTHGIAHLAEHAAFSGTPTAPMGVLIDAVEARGGEANAFTRDDMTVFYDHEIPTAMLADVLEMEADRMRNVTFSDADFRHERDRLEAEEQSTNEPQLQLRQWRRHAAFGGQTYGAGLFDAAGNSRAPGLDAAVVQAFYDEWYQPGRATVVVVGPNPEKALAMVRAAFDDIPAPVAPTPHRVGIDLMPPTPGTVEFNTGLTRARAERVWVGPGLDQITDRLALEAFALLHSGQPPTDGETREVFVDGMLGSSLFVVAVTGDDADEGARQLAAQITSGTLTQDALERAKAAMGESLSNRSVRTRPYFSLAVDVGLYSRWGLLGPLLEHDANVRALTVDDVKGAVSRWLTPDRAWTLRYQPDEAGLAALPSDRDALHAAGIAAAESGDLARAIAAFERLLSLTTDDMNVVIYRYTLGDLNFRLRRHGEARRHLEAGLAVIDYPALRELLEQVDAADGMGTPPPTVADVDAAPVGGADEAATSVRVVDTTGATPAWATEAASVMGRLERWREVPFKTDLVIQFEESAGEGIAGYYQPSTKTLVVGLSNSERFNRGTMLHEMFHALQDQHFDLSALDSSVDGLDGERALAGLIEGEAMLAVSELMDYDFFAHGKLPQDGPIDPSRFQGIYRYGDGQRFVKHLRDVGGWPLVSDAFRDPPRSSAEIYHPDRYLNGWRYRPPRRLPRVRLGGTDQIIMDDSMGEYGLRMLLACSPETRPLAPVLGAALSGDRQITIRTPSGALRMEWALVFENEASATRFSEVAATAAAAVPAMTKLEVVHHGYRRGARGHAVGLSWTVPAPVH